MSRTENGRLPSLEEHVTDYVRNFSRERLKTCKVCDSPNRELIDIILRQGGASSVADFLSTRMGESISIAVLSRHKKCHLDAEAEKR